MVKYITDIKKLFQEGIRQAKEEDILPQSFNKRVIPLDTPTRWNSTYYMISTALELQQPLNYIYRNTANKDTCKACTLLFVYSIYNKLEALIEEFENLAIEEPELRDCVQEELNIIPAVENTYDASDDDDEFYTQPTEEMEYITYLREPIAGKKY
ncbi:hypothetical protein B0T14DRAFT_492339 [Immersiella caudata]|uniref:Uncharacterized protein n=1 Tax=Immersiella caudata TaxID=314043 RepID=A0AA39X331_9PEZI|nr:hypothetical protein B0T14DRAFT_492339 [Immersiella caudata]